MWHSCAERLKGRVVAGRATAQGHASGRLKERGDEVVVRAASVVPEREAWLYQNEEALSAVRKGLEQARAWAVVRGPRLGTAAKLGGKAR
ncbi:MAG: hypothetical protein KF859_10040 [Phycisphaeraceae bacterium]|nr:hypothetical protein [Phycisphaeraceae bacterium]